jgi:hypothetical protein
LQIVKKGGPKPIGNSYHYSLQVKSHDGTRHEYALPENVSKLLEDVLLDPNLSKTSFASALFYSSVLLEGGSLV